jgi:hypothetical protein
VLGGSGFGRFWLRLSRPYQCHHCPADGFGQRWPHGHEPGQFGVGYTPFGFLSHYARHYAPDGLFFGSACFIRVWTIPQLKPKPAHLRLSLLRSLGFQPLCGHLASLP